MIANKKDLMKKILNIGPRAFACPQDRTGGIVVLFEDWISYCQEKKMTIDVIDSNKSNYSNKINAVFTIIWKTLVKIRQSDTIFLHGTINDYIYIAPLIVCIAHVARRRVVLRKFAGNFSSIYQNCNWFKKTILHYAISNADAVCWETQELVKWGKKFNSHSYWFPNVRHSTKIHRVDRPYSCRLVFLSRVEREKGIGTLVEAMKILGSGYTLDIWGPLNDVKENELNGFNYSYKGCVAQEDVPRTLAMYDILVLPTKWIAEGYPGVIIEAYNVGIPVVATPMGAIPEIVQDGVTGFLTPVGDAHMLAQTIKKFNVENYICYSAAALNAFVDFNSEIVCDRIKKIL